MKHTADMNDQELTAYCQKLILDNNYEQMKWLIQDRDQILKERNAYKDQLDVLQKSSNEAVEAALDESYANYKNCPETCDTNCDICKGQGVK